jgi:hypothetical protein
MSWNIAHKAHIINQLKYGTKMSLCTIYQSSPTEDRKYISFSARYNVEDDKGRLCYHILLTNDERRCLLKALYNDV